MRHFKKPILKNVSPKGLREGCKNVSRPPVWLSMGLTLSTDVKVLKFLISKHSTNQKIPHVGFNVSKLKKRIH